MATFEKTTDEVKVKLVDLVLLSNGYDIAVDITVRQSSEWLQVVGANHDGITAVLVDGSSVDEHVAIGPKEEVESYIVELTTTYTQQFTAGSLTVDGEDWFDVGAQIEVDEEWEVLM